MLKIQTAIASDDFNDGYIDIHTLLQHWSKASHTLIELQRLHEIIYSEKKNGFLLKK